MATKKNEIVVKLNEVAILREEAGKLFFTPKAEDAITKIFRLQEILEEALEYAKLRIAEAGLKDSSSFKSVSSDKIRAVFQLSGYKYFIQENMPLDELIKLGLVKEKCSYSIDSDAVDEYIEKNGQLPVGISANNRVPKMQLTPKKKKGEVINA